ncbi:glycosyltransferase family 2 protein [Flavobacterium sp.]|uniref:glycosyltransferase family 2 protein n=1 Tax=Flavobacterium sp. TaxID=239 RepID=UPI00260AB9D9|nr:glycosyltransferase family 2 protein [Flavobacterium sp.]
MIERNQPLVSIIIAFYNEQELLSRCLQSVRDQTHKNLEVVLINDGSTDHSVAIAEKFRSDFRLFKMISIENSGHSEARNFGLKNASGEFLTFLDADDELEPEMVSVCLKKMLENDADLVISMFTIFNQNGISEMVSGWKARNQNITKTKDLSYEMFNHGISENVWAKLFKSNLAKQIVFEKGLWFDDRPFMFEYLFVADTVSFVKDSLLKIHKRNASITRRIIEPKRLIDWHRVFELELKIVQKYGSDEVLKNKIAIHYLSVLMDNYLIQIIEQKKVRDLKKVRKTFFEYLKKYCDIVKSEKIILGSKDKIILKLLLLPKFLGWNLANNLIEVLKRKRISGLKKLK